MVLSWPFRFEVNHFALRFGVHRVAQPLDRLDLALLVARERVPVEHAGGLPSADGHDVGLADASAKISVGGGRAQGLYGESSRIAATWQEGADGPFDVFISFAKKLDPGAGSPTVTLAGDINDDFTATVTGGSIVLRDRDGKPNKHLALACPNLDAVVFNLVR